MSEFDQKEFRNTCGMFATGITIVTTTDSSGNPIGMTANSFASVSLDPPLVLWSVGNHANSFDIFSNADHYAVYMHKGQQDLSNLFASRGENKFGDLNWTVGEVGSPILPDYSVCFQCEMEHVFPGGDHNILVGRVMTFKNQNKTDALLFFSGGYQSIST